MGASSALPHPRGGASSALPHPAWTGPRGAQDGSESHAARRKACVERRVPGGVLFATGAGACICYSSVSPWKLPVGRGRATLPSRRGGFRHGPLQEQPARHRVQPLRGASAAQDVLGTGPYADVDADTARSILARSPASPRTSSPRRFADADRNPPVFDPATPLGDACPSRSRSRYQAYMDAEWWRPRPPRRARRHRRPAVAALGGRRDGPRRQPGRRTCTPPSYCLRQLL